MSPVLIQREPVAVKLTKTVVKLIKDDLTALPVDAFIYYAREDLALGSGYGTAIQQRGGPSIKQELNALGGVEMGRAVITGAGAMKAKHIIHACGPKFHEPELKRKLQQCVRSALEVADANGLGSIAFPPLGAGFYGVPIDLCATVMRDVIADYVRSGTSLNQIIICVIDTRDFEAFRGKLAAL